MIQILHNISCSKSRAAVEFIDEQPVDCNIRNFIEQPLNVDELKDLLQKLQRPIIDIVRTDERLYQEKFADKNLNDNQLLNMLAENPVLLQRPIIIKDNQAIIGRPAHLIEAFIKE